MFIKKKLLLCFMMSLILFMTTSCTKKEIETNKELEVNNTKSYSKVTLMKNSSSKLIEEFKLINGKKDYIDSLKPIANFKYSIKDNVYLYQFIKSTGQSLSNSYISITKNNKSIELDDFYSASDITMSPKGTAVAFRAYANDDYLSFEDKPRIFDIDKNKYKEIPIDTLISGNLFKWYGENTLIYYGVKTENNLKKAALYKFDFEKNEEYEEKSFKGNITFMDFVNSDELIILLRVNEKKSQLIKYNLASKEYTILNDSIDTIYDMTFFKDDIFILAKDVNNIISIFNINSLGKIKRLIYDFPKKVHEKGGLTTDEKGNLYFLDIDADFNSNVYMINRENNSINLIIDDLSYYHLYKAIN